MWNEATSAPFPVAGRRPIRFPSRDSDRTIPPSLSIGSHWKYFEVTYYVVLEPHKITSIALSHQTSIRFVSTGGHRAERPLNVKANGRHCGLDLMRCLCYETVYKIVATSWKQNGLCFCIVSHVIEYVLQSLWHECPIYWLLHIMPSSRKQTTQCTNFLPKANGNHIIQMKTGSFHRCGCHQWRLFSKNSLRKRCWAKLQTVLSVRSHEVDNR